MEYLTISQVSRKYGVTPRMLRHYEKLGLIKTGRREDYAYRIYDEEAVRRLQQILILRKLRLSLKEIAVLLGDTEQDESLRLLLDKLAELDNEIASLTLIRRLLKQLAERLGECRKQQIHFDLLKDGDLVEITGALAFPKTKIKENMGGCLEEHLNWVYAAHNGWKEDGLPGQIDLMLPVKMRER